MANHAHCLGRAGLAVFAVTADQRYLLGPGVFLRTHFPIVLRRFQNGRDPEVVSEDALLAQLLAPVSKSQGNRVFVLYGAAGSGKSELLRWVQTRLEQETPARAEVMVRVARTELDALTISERFRRLLDQGYFDEATHRRWQMARQKPRTLTKLVVLSALESLLDEDETINALFYRLTNAIQPHMAHCLGTTNTLGAVDILSQETWEKVVSETVLPVPVDYEALRHQMLVALQSHLLEGLNLPRTLRQISEHVLSTHKLRPILLVDDLVQSLNLFATDLLDYFVTLESGQWDVVLGLTPAAFETTRRGRELLQRIAYLDTLDDRVTKLWLSDDVGSESYFLNEDNCHRFAACYLTEHRRLNAAAAEETDGVGSCLAINGDSSLCPFNRELLVRVFRGLPVGKGKARYFLRALHEVLERTGNGTSLLATLDGVAKVEGAARCEDAQLARIAELYGPFVGEQGSITLGVDLVRFFGLGGTSITLDIEPLTRRRLVHQAVTDIVDDEEKAAIRDWLQGRPVNRQLLKGLRRGAARWLRVVAAPDLLYRDGIARPHGVLRWKRTYLDTSPPICLEGVDDETEGIWIGREIGSVAFDLHRFATATGKAARQILAQLSAECRLLPTLLAAADARTKAVANLEAQLGTSIKFLALRLYVLLCLVKGPPAESVPGFAGNALTAPYLTHHALSAGQSFDAEMCLSIVRLLEDWFKLRDNVWDGPGIACGLAGFVPEALLEPLLRVDEARVDRDYWLGRQRLSQVLHQIKPTVRDILARTENDSGHLSPAARSLVDRLRANGEHGVLLNQVPAEVLAELRDTAPDLYARLSIVVSHVPAG